MEFPKYNYPLSWRRTSEDIPKLSDDYGCYGAVAFTESASSNVNDNDNSQTSNFAFNFKRNPGKQERCHYTATSTSLPLLHPEEDPGIPDVTIEDLFQYTLSFRNKNQPVRNNRAAQQAAYFYKNYPDIAFDTSETILSGCFRTVGEGRIYQKYKKKYRNSVVPVKVGNLEKENMYRLLGDVLSDIPIDLTQTLLHEEIESLSKKIVNNPLYCGGCIAYQQVRKNAGVVLGVCGPSLDILKIQPISVKRVSSKRKHADFDHVPTSHSSFPSHTPSQDVTSLKSPTPSRSVASFTSPKPFHTSSTLPLVSSTPLWKTSLSPSVNSQNTSQSSSDDIARPAPSKRGGADYRLLTEKEPHLIAFQGVIRQITSTKASFQELVYVGIRTDYHCYILTIESNSDDLKFQILHTVKFQHQLTFIALSPFIHGECVITLENGGVDLITESGVETQISPVFEGFTGSVWRQCHFGSHARLIVSTEHKKIDLIDTKDTGHLKETNLFQLPSKHLTTLEDILVSRQHPNNYFFHFVATHHQLLMFDERLPQVPILEWNHLLTTPPNYIDVFAPVNKDHVVMVASYASNEAHCFQFKVKKAKPPSVVGPGWKIATIRGWFSLLPSLPSASHVYEAARQRLEKPFIGVCIIGHQSSKHSGFTTLMSNSLGDVFYQTYISTHHRPALDKTLNVGPGCPEFKLNKAELKRCYDWLNALTLDYEKNPIDDGCLVDAKKIDASDLCEEVCMELEPDPGCPFCCKEPTTSRYGHMSPLNCPACGLNPDVSFNLLEKYNTESCILTKKSLGMSDAEEEEEIIGDDLDVELKGLDTDEVGQALLRAWKASATDIEPNDIGTNTPKRQHTDSQGKSGRPPNTPNQDVTDSRNVNQEEIPLSQDPASQESIDMFSQSNSQSQTIRQSGRKRKRPAKLRGVMGF
ncbi:uncharacterized protein [Antedon mediterranea]|uniref:uncharacterized protein n=1 Tax=Antedon mediterranea TaxID=105859 RepID=UPI003AF75394